MNQDYKINYVDLVIHADIPSPTMKHILLTIAALANENGKCRPSISRLAKLTGFDKRTITRNLRKLENGGWLDIDRVGTQFHRETSFYELNLLKLQTEKNSVQGRGSKPLPGAQSPHLGGTESVNTKDTNNDENRKFENSYIEIDSLFR
ncbi:helix-turn-helix domain-containing protein [Marinihelvus fidelis]|nr:helix-turn-helix domain-containing protein [Marinihelvus fidelis]